MKKITIGDKVILNGNEGKEVRYLAAMDKAHTYNGIPCVFLATDIQNKNTYGRYSQQFLNQCGYCL